MDSRRSSSPPEGFGRDSVDRTVVTTEKFDEVAAEAERFRESLAQDIPLSKETGAARNLLFLSTLLTILIMHSDVEEVTLAGWKIKFPHGIADIKLFAVIVTMTLGIHYIAAAFSEFLAEYAKRTQRRNGIKKHLDYIGKAGAVFEERIVAGNNRGEEISKDLARRYEIQKDLNSMMTWLDRHDRIAMIYNLLTPIITILLMAGLLIYGYYR